MCDVNNILIDRPTNSKRENSTLWTNEIKDRGILVIGESHLPQIPAEYCSISANLKSQHLQTFEYGGLDFPCVKDIHPSIYPNAVEIEADGKHNISRLVTVFQRLSKGIEEKPIQIYRKTSKRNIIFVKKFLILQSMQLLAATVREMALEYFCEGMAALRISEPVESEEDRQPNGSKEDNQSHASESQMNCRQHESFYDQYEIGEIFDLMLNKDETTVAEEVHVDLISRLEPSLLKRWKVHSLPSEAAHLHTSYDSSSDDMVPARENSIPCSKANDQIYSANTRLPVVSFKPDLRTPLRFPGMSMQANIKIFLSNRPKTKINQRAEDTTEDQTEEPQRFHFNNQNLYERRL